MLENILGILKVKVQKGVDLAIRDVSSSDPYVVVRLGKLKVRTRVIKKTTNPEWDDELTLAVEDPSLPLRFEVFDHDFFRDDPMGYAELDIKPLLDAVKRARQGIPNGTVMQTMIPNRQNFLAEESRVYCKDGKIFQDVAFRLRNVETGEIEVQLWWVDVPGSKGLSNLHEFGNPSS